MPIDRLHALMHVFAALVVGGRCPGCRDRTLQPLCAACHAELRAITPAPDAALRDEGVAGRIARRAKHGHWRAGALALTPLLVERIGGTDWLRAHVDVATWIPADAGRRRRRGGHLPEQLARGMARRSGIRAQPLLVRHRARAQRGLDEHARVRNVEGMFRLRARRGPTWAFGGRSGRVAPIRVLLLDDVRTTGATLAAAAAVLEQAGHRVVPYALVGVPRRDGARGQVYGETRTVRGKPAHEGAADCR